MISKIQDAPPSFQEHQQQKTKSKRKDEYNAVPSAPTMDDGDFNDVVESNADKFGEAMATTQLALLKTDEMKKTEPGPDTAPNKSQPQRSELNRLNTLQRAHTFHKDTLYRTTQGFDNISSGCSSIGSAEILLICFVILTILCFGVAIYGIYSGNELNLMWSEFSPEEINADCQGKYKSEFTYVHKRKRKDIGVKFVSMVVMGSIEIGLFAIICCYSFIRVTYLNDEDDNICRGCCAFALMYTWALGVVWSISWFVLFINCLQFYNDVMEYCDEESMVYQDTEDIFSWFYPLVIFEIVKGSLMLCICCSGFIWAMIKGKDDN